MWEELKKGYEVKEGFGGWFRRGKEIGRREIKKVKYEVEEVLIRFKREGILEMCDVIKRLKNWEREIVKRFV
nr:transposase [Paenibacillus bovis]